MSSTHRIAVVVFLLGVLLAVPRWLDRDQQEERVARLTAEYDRVAAANAAQRTENLRLFAEVEALRTDPALLERRVRDELPWIAEDEVLFLFVSAESRAEWTREALAEEVGP